MQNKYVADIGDFGKFQLFRYLFNHRQSVFNGKQLSQIWFMHKGEGESNNDGRHVDYFSRVQGSDVALENALIDILNTNARDVTEFEKRNLLHNTCYFYDEVPKTLEKRYAWLQDALAFSDKCHVVAVEPDNGMALKCQRNERSFLHLSLTEHHRQKNTPHKYIFSDEVAHFYQLSHVEICIVYQHLSRCFSHNEQIDALLRGLNTQYHHTLAIKHKPYSPRVFFFLCKSEAIRDSLHHRLTEFAREHHDFWEVFT
ncbi:MAG: Unknown protein [uncultured Sulfurovum sp.]|uniref:Uncharacterized protein n=1 Tax=uncultured Sulfurovum sp. TaxID=269237 RepID=A0A6S6SJ49_9BACT|nr:MAG: Unknown protein [uncultured Sulfurovum sp.]